MQTDLNKFRNIIFDLGGVILNIDYDLTVQAFAKLGLRDFQTQFSKATQTGLFDAYEKGEINSAEFRRRILELLPASVTEEMVNDAWNAILLDLPASRLELLKRLQKTHRTFLLSNTNDIHMLEFNKRLKAEFGAEDFSPFFEKIYLSHLVGMRKPDEAVFRRILEENGLKAEETLFIDDSIQHVRSAEATGITAVWLDLSKQTVEDLFT